MPNSDERPSNSASSVSTTVMVDWALKTNNQSINPCRQSVKVPFQVTRAYPTSTTRPRCICSALNSLHTPPTTPNASRQLLYIYIYLSQVVQCRAAIRHPICMSLNLVKSTFVASVCRHCVLRVDIRFWSYVWSAGVVRMHFLFSNQNLTKLHPCFCRVKCECCAVGLFFFFT